MMRFRSTRAVVIGGTRGIGLATSLGLAREGAAVIVGAREVGDVDPVLKASSESGELALAVCDVTDPNSVADFIQSSADALGGIDVLVNCATAAVRDATEAGWRRSLDTDLMGPVRALQFASPFLRQSDHAAVVNMSSISARGGRPDALPYGAAKAAVEQFTFAAARLHAPDKIRINCVVPGSTEFEGGLWNELRTTHPALWARTRDAIPLGGFAGTSEISDTILFLASRQSRWITGQCLVVDGGQLFGGGV